MQPQPKQLGTPRDHHAEVLRPTRGLALPGALVGRQRHGGAGEEPRVLLLWPEAPVVGNHSSHLFDQRTEPISLFYGKYRDPVIQALQELLLRKCASLDDFLHSLSLKYHVSL